MKNNVLEKTKGELYNSQNIESIQNIRERIFVFRDKPVMIDRDLADLYSVSTKRINEQVKRNVERFPERFRFQLSNIETLELVAN